MTKLNDYQCPDCSAVFEVLSHGGELWLSDFFGFSESKEIPLKGAEEMTLISGCPACKLPFEKMILLARRPQLRGDGTDSQKLFEFGYFDRGLGCFVRGKKHREQICKEKGLIPIEGDWEGSQSVKEDDRAEEAYQKDLENYANNPNFREAWELADKGHPDFAHLKGLFKEYRR